MAKTGGYQVLARKYRPETFADLVGQDTMVRTLRNAFAADRIAQAFVLTGIRGTGKTTTARIIAKGMNCTGRDGPTTDPCGACPQCCAIATGQHVDVVEMDAASNTGVDNIRQNVIDSVTYAPAESRYKIYIIDEVHMLSTSAFNALLKTLEEPPAHVKFIFATTEIRKVPVTVLSRCQRFDLRRLEGEDLIAMLRRIAQAEGAEITDGALALIARAAEGSARDATSLLDQAIGNASGEIDAEAVRAMLGLADRGRVLDLFDLVMRGDAAGALGELADQYAGGADPAAVLRDLAETAHWLSVAKVTPEAAEDPTLPPDLRQRGTDMAARLSHRVLGRAWQMLLKALEEVALAPNAMMAAEMTLIRMTHVADLPPPGDLLKRLSALDPSGGPTPTARPPAGDTPRDAPASGGAPPGQAPASAPALGHAPSGGARTGPAQATAAVPDALARFATFDDVVALIRARRDIPLLLDVETGLHLVAYSPGRIEFRPAEGAPADLAQRLGARLQAWTGARWTVTVSAGAPGAPTIAGARAAAEAALKDRAARIPQVAAILQAVPGAQIAAVRTRAEIAAQAASEALPDTPETGADDAGWTPLEEDTD